MSPAVIDGVLGALARREAVDARVALVVAHPDDETIGLGPFLRLFRHLTMLHVTDGAPRDLHDARIAGFTTCEDYAAARQRELRAALLVGGTGLPATFLRPVPDQSASLHLRELAQRLRDALQDAAVVLTHAYEGGHPDHDAVAFAVHATGRPVIEITGYHAAPDGGIEVGRFLPNGDTLGLRLTDEERACRDAMLACFGTQRATLAPFFGWAEQCLRPAPRYDFTRPAAARCYYDGFDWGMRSTRWCSLAVRAQAC